MELDLQRVLKQKNMSVAELERITEKNGEKVSRVSIFKIMNNETSPKVETLNTLAKALDVSIFDLFQDPQKRKDIVPIYKKGPEGNFIEIGYLIN